MYSWLISHLIRRNANHTWYYLWLFFINTSCSQFTTELLSICPGLNFLCQSSLNYPLNKILSLSFPTYCGWSEVSITWFLNCLSMSIISLNCSRFLLLQNFPTLFWHTKLYILSANLYYSTTPSVIYSTKIQIFIN